MREAPVSVILPEEIDGNIKRAGERLARLRGAYRCGLLSGQQLRDEAALVFEEGFESFLADKRLRLRVAPGDWPVFAGALNAWKSDRQEAHLRACSWLYFFVGNEAKDIRFRDEAAAADKAGVLRLMEAFRVPAEYFRPVPEGIVCPDERPAHFPSEFIVGDRIWVNDESLAQGRCGPGEEITLVDHHGLKTELRIGRRIPDAEKSSRQDADYLCTGSVGGYTSARKRKIRVYIRDGRVSSLRFFKESDDYAVDCPLWREYRKDRDEIAGIRERIIDGMIDNLK